MQRFEQRQGFWNAMPLTVLLLLIFVAPLAVVALFSVMPPRVFDILHAPHYENYLVFFQQSYYRSLLWSLGMATITTVALFLICYPLAHAMVRVFKRFALVITVAIVISLLVSENIRLFGWVLTLMKGGLISGYLQHLSGIPTDGVLYNVPVIVLGQIYVYLPFMLFPLVQGISMVPEDIRRAASDLGASRTRVLFEIDLPLAMPGIFVGSMLSFVLAAGAMAESKLLGGQAVIVMSDEIETAFTYGQNWSLGSALAMILIVIIGSLAFFTLSRIDLDGITGRK